MKSNHYAKTTGEGGDHDVTKSPTLSPCQHINGKGHRCHQFTTDPASGLCAHHSRQKAIRQGRQNHAVAQALLAESGDFGSPDCVVRFLGNLLREVAHKRVDRRDAATMAYVAQLLINSQAAFSRFVDLDLKVQDASFAQVLAQHARGAVPNDTDRD